MHRPAQSFALLAVVGWVFALGGCASVTSVVRTAEPLDSASSEAPAPREELWIIEKGSPTAAHADHPGGASLLARGSPKSPVPLKRTDVKAFLNGASATVELHQQFANTSKSPIEAVYVLPLPDGATVTDFVLTLGSRKIRAIVREKEEAERIYNQAKAQGYVASLFTNVDGNVFTQAISNIQPGQEVDVDLQYEQLLAETDGWRQFEFPMTVHRPRAAAERSGRDISMTVHIEGMTRGDAVECKTHAVSRREAGKGSVEVALTPKDAIPNRDFVLRYKTSGNVSVAGLSEKVQRVALRSGSLSPFTAFIVVDTLSQAQHPSSEK